MTMETRYLVMGAVTLASLSLDGLVAVVDLLLQIRARRFVVMGEDSLCRQVIVMIQML